MFRLLRTREGDGKRDRELGKCFKSIITKSRDFPGGIVDKNSPARDMVQSMVREDSTCLGATKPITKPHNY